MGREPNAKEIEEFKGQAEGDFFGEGDIPSEENIK